MNMSRRLIEARVSNVCFWHADIPTVFRDVRFQGIADIGRTFFSVRF
jgi:hypothetical protein